MAKAGEPALLIMDTGPLITLAAAESLDYLLIPKLPVCIPDAVFFEATSRVGALGAESIIDWAQSNVFDVQVVPTAVYASFVAGKDTDPELRKNLGERAAVEVGRDTALLTGGDYCFLLTEDDKVLRGRYLVPDDEPRIEMISTRDFLEALERTQLINSADSVYEKANDAGRPASTKRKLKEADDLVIAALEALLKTNGPKQ